MKIGITATRAGLTDWQKQALKRQLILAQASEVHHGDCQGGDADAHEIARELGLVIIGHPPSNPSQRALCKCDLYRAPKPYLERNHEIVKECHVLLAFPKTSQEEKRGSGTWATIRYARKTKVPVMIFAGDLHGPPTES